MNSRWLGHLPLGFIHYWVNVWSPWGNRVPPWASYRVPPWASYFSHAICELMSKNRRCPPLCSYIAKNVWREGGVYKTPGEGDYNNTYLIYIYTTRLRLEWPGLCALSDPNFCAINDPILRALNPQSLRSSEDLLWVDWPWCLGCVDLLQVSWLTYPETACRSACWSIARMRHASGCLWILLSL